MAEGFLGIVEAKKWSKSDNYRINLAKVRVEKGHLDKSRSHDNVFFDILEDHFKFSTCDQLNHSKYFKVTSVITLKIGSVIVIIAL